jgi:hypothetical protein
MPVVVIDHATARDAFYRGALRRSPVNDHLFEILRESFRRYLPEERDYADAFTTFEYLLAACFIERAAVRNRGVYPDFAPLGRFGWQVPMYRESRTITRLHEEAQKPGPWAPVVAGIFASNDSFLSAAVHLNKLRQGIR